MIPSSQPISKILIKKIQNNKKFSFLDYIATELELDCYLENNFLFKFFVSPHKLKELIIGFCVCEGIINPYKNNISIFFTKDNKKIIANIKIENTPLLSHKKSDGLQEPILLPEKILSLFSLFKNQELLFHKTGAFHSAYLIDNKNLQILSFCEDIGRFNTIDKTIGEALLKNLELQNKILLISGRIFKKTIKKLQNAGIKIIISKGAPTYEAAKLAEKHNITLIGFLRNNSFNIYSHAWRIKD